MSYLIKTLFSNGILLIWLWKNLHVTDLLNVFITGPMKRHYLLERKREPQVRLWNKTKKRSVCCNILIKFIKFTEFLSPKFGASKRKVYDILLKFNHPKVNLKVSYTMKVSSNNEVFMLLQNFRFPVSFCPSTRNKSEWGGK